MNILICCAGRRNYLVSYFKDEAVGLVLASNSNPFSSAMRVADKAFVVPEVLDPKYIDYIIRICKENEVKLVLSVFDYDLPVLAKNRKKFERLGIVLAVSSEDVIDICLDKWLSVQFLSDNNIQTPRAYVQTESCLESLEKGLIQFPLIIKPRWGTGSIGLLVVENMDELLSGVSMVKRKINQTYVKRFSLSDENILMQEFLVGEEYGLDVINDFRGNYVTTFVKRKIAMRSGETDAAVTIKDDELESLGFKLSTSLKHVGILDVDVMKVGNQLYVLEMNPRFGGGYPFSHLAGANIPAAYVAWASGKKPKKEWLQVASGVRGVKGVSIFPVATNYHE